MKIAFVNDTFLEGRGADTVIYELAKRLGKKHDVYVLTPESNFKEDNFKIIKINAKKLLTGNTFYDALNYFFNLRRFRKDILKFHKNYNFDIFNAHHSSLNPAFGGLSVIITWHGSPPSKNFLRKFLNRLVLKSLNKNKISIAISDYIKSELSKIVPEDKIKRIYNGISEEFRPKIKNNDKGYMLYVGRFEEHKGVSELIKLSKEINFPLNLVGSGPLESKLKDYAKEINADKVRFLGKIPREELIKQYKECSFFISASKWEGFGLIFIEAAACAKSSIGYAKSAIPEVILDNKTGFLADNFSELKQKAKILIKDKKLKIKMGKEALKFSKNFSWNKAATEYEKVFKEILE